MIVPTRQTPSFLRALCWLSLAEKKIMSNQEKIRSKKEMFAIIEENLQSELTHTAFCSWKGIAEWMFYYWQKKYRKE